MPPISGTKASTSASRATASPLRAASRSSRSGLGARDGPCRCAGLTPLPGLDVDVARPALLGLGDADGQHAFVERGLHALAISPPGQGHAVLEAAPAASASAQYPSSLALLDLSGDGQLGVVNLDV